MVAYIMVIKTHGRCTGKRRYTPVNYAFNHGYVYCTAGFGSVSHWYKNLSNNPQVELLLPSGAVTANAEVVNEIAEKRIALRQVLVNSGFAAFVFGGFNPYRVSEEKIIELTRDYIVIRFRTAGIAAGSLRSRRLVLALASRGPCRSDLLAIPITFFFAYYLLYAIQIAHVNLA